MYFFVMFNWWENVQIISKYVVIVSDVFQLIVAVKDHNG